VSAATQLRAPFPWFGGKSRAASIVWDAFGDVRSYVEPFAGSLAVLLARPQPFKGAETVNDLDCYVANFWRALRQDPAGVAEHADWPVNEADLHARHQWLVDSAAFRERMLTDPENFDVRVAGWWVWGQSAWIGSGWCDRRKWRNGPGAQGVNRQLPRLTGAQGVNRQLPHLTGGRGVRGYMEALASRLRGVRIACGDWTRVLGAMTDAGRQGRVGVLLDPPYRGARNQAYAAEGTGSSTVADECAAWATENGARAGVRIALCGYAGDYDMPDGWRVVPWKAVGGYANQSDGRQRNEECVWLSPECRATGQLGLFGE